MHYFIKGVAVTGLSLAMSGAVLAASDGALGSSSTGSSDISVTVATGIQLTGFADFTTAYVGSGDITFTDGLCLYTNGAGYDIKAAGDNDDGGVFNLADATDTVDVPYTVQFSDVGGGNSTTLVAGAADVAGSTTFSGLLNCGGGNNVQMRVDIQEADLTSAPADTYTDTLVITVTAT